MKHFSFQGLHWHLRDELPTEAVGLLPMFLSEASQLGAVDQLHTAYAHGGGWHDFKGFELKSDRPVEQWVLEYPEDPPMRLMAYVRLRDELIALFESSWVAVVARDGSYRVARMD